MKYSTRVPAATFAELPQPGQRVLTMTYGHKAPRPVKVVGARYDGDEIVLDLDAPLTVVVAPGGPLPEWPEPMRAEWGSLDPPA